MTVSEDRASELHNATCPGTTGHFGAGSYGNDCVECTRLALTAHAAEAVVEALKEAEARLNELAINADTKECPDTDQIRTGCYQHAAVEVEAIRRYALRAREP